MATNAKHIIPAMATHPGSVLKSELRERCIKQKDFARAIGMPASNLSEIIKGKRHVTEAIAMKLEQALGIPFQTWMNLQNRYHYVTRQRQELDAAEASASEQEQSIAQRVNLPAVYKHFGINENLAAKRISMLHSALGPSLDLLDEREAKVVGYFRRSEKLRIDDRNMLTWLLLAWCEAEKAELSAPYRTENCLTAAGEIARAANDGKLSLDLVQTILNRNSIVFCRVPKLDATPVDAYSFMAGEHPAIVVTCRHNDADKLAFDVLHELGHIRLHLQSGKSYISVESDYSSLSPEEREANEFANNALIPPKTWKSMMSAGAKNLSPHIVARALADEAKRHGISPSIAVARYKHETKCYNIRGFRSAKITQ